ncbi:MAG: hypothetical protein VB084_07885 [Syntrophomonadaceae bacterium]|nr:hypothetical protein [Syntrophomonadaceae bacterium]
MNFTFGTLFFVILFIIPGYLAYTVYTFLHKTYRAQNDYEITFKSLLNSGFIYLIYYPLYAHYHQNSIITLANDNITIQEISSTNLLWFLGLLSGSVLWGVILSLIARYINDSNFVNLLQSKEPPNLYASAMDPNYSELAQTGFWLRFPYANEIKQGLVVEVDVAANERLAWVSNIKDLTRDGEVLCEYPDSYRLLVDLTKLNWFEVIFDTTGSENNSFP